MSESTVTSTTNTIATSADSTDVEAPNSNASTLTEKVGKAQLWTPCFYFYLVKVKIEYRFFVQLFEKKT